MMDERRCDNLPRKFYHGIDPVSFYGSTCNRLFEDTSTNVLPAELSPRFSRLLGPSLVWKVFKKQHDLIEFVSSNNCGLFPFTYQINDGTRLFLAADPITFWYFDEQRDPAQRHSYEIIQENQPCKLYFDLEFDVKLNPNHDGFEMVNIFIDLVCIALRNKYNIVCQTSDILDLDSSTDSKFSCHLIFPTVIFLNNFQAGYFVKQLCFEIISAAHTSSILNLLKGVDTLGKLRELLVMDSKGRTRLFCDEAVYSKNRHFRIYKSSKFGKHAVLKVSERNRFEVTGKDLVTKEEKLFLFSLITYCNHSEVKLTYECDNSTVLERNRLTHGRTSSTNVTTSPYTEIDKCINRIVSPGKIYRSHYFPENKVIIYDIVGNRYCGNIGRPHKSNNVKYVVDVESLTYYQKCYDPDCAEYKSPKKKLPVDEHLFINNNIDDELVLAAANRYELSVPLHKTAQPYREIYPSSEDEDLIEAAERCELMNRSRGRSLIFQDSDDLVLSNGEDHESLEDGERSELCNFQNVSDHTDELMVSVAENSESLLRIRKRKIIKETAEEGTFDRPLNLEHSKRKLIDSAIFQDMDEDLIVATTEMCEKFLNFNNI